MANRPDTVAVRLAIEGAQEILNQLIQLGAGGEKALAQLRSAVGESEGVFGSFGSAVTAASAKVSQGLARVSEVGASIGSFKLGTVASEFDKFESSVGKVVTRVALMEAAILGASAAIVKLIKDAGKSAQDTEDTALTLGLSTEQYQKLQFAAAASGIEQEKLGPTMRNLAKTFTEAADAQGKSLEDFNKRLGISSASVLAAAGLIGNAGDRARAGLDAMGVRTVGVGEKFDALRQKMVDMGVRFVDLGLNIGTSTKPLSEQEKVLSQLGVRLVDATGKLRPFDDRLGDLAEGFKNLGKGEESVKLATTLFGRFGNVMLPLLLKGRDGLAELKESFHQLGIGITDADAALGEKSNVSFTKLSFLADGLKTKVGLIFTPALIEVVDAFTKALQKNGGAIQEFAKNLATKLGPEIDDIVKLLSGKQLSFGDFGEETFVKKAVKIFNDFKATISEWGAAASAVFEKFMSAAQAVADVINAVFGTNVSAKMVIIVAVLGTVTGAFSLLFSVVTLGAAVIKTLVLGFALLSTPIAAVLRLVGLFVTSIVGAAAAVLGLPAIVVAGIVIAIAAVTALLFVYKDQIVAAFVGAWEHIKSGFAGLGAALADLWNTFLSDLADAWESIKSGAAAAWKWVADKASAAWDTVKGLWGGLGSFLDDAWTSIKDGAAAAWQAIKDGASAAWEGIRTIFSSGGGSLSGAWDSIKSGASAAWNFVVDGATNVLSKVSAALAPIASAVTAPLSALVEGVSGLFQGLVDAAKSLAESIGRVTSAGFDLSKFIEIGAALLKPFTDADAAIRQVFTGLLEFITATVASVTQAFTTMQDGLSTFASSIGERVTSAFTDALANVQTFASQIEAVVQQMLASVAEAKAATEGGDFSGAQSRAGGGPIFGAGTSTSDSILAWLSNYEFVQPARAVAHYGMKMMEDIRNLRFPKLAIGGFVNKVAMGAFNLPTLSLKGAVDIASRAFSMPPIPRLADGGTPKFAAAGRAIFIPPFAGERTGFTARIDDEREAHRLDKAASRARNSSAHKYQPGSN